MAAKYSEVTTAPEIAGVEHSYVQLHDGRLHIATMGAGAPVLLLHGFGQTWWEFRDLIPAIAKAGYRAIAPDLRGEGWSELPINPMTRLQRFHDVVSLLDQLGLKSVAMVSHDLGAITAFQLALELPERFSSQIMVAVPPPQMRFSVDLIPGMKNLWHQEALAVPYLGRKLMASGTMFRHFFSPKFLTKALDDEVLAQYEKTMKLPQFPRAAELLCRQVVLPELARIIAGSYRSARFAMPSQFIFGAKDSGFPAAVLRKVFEDSSLIGPDVQLEVIQDAGHFVIDEQPQAVSRTVLAFLDTHRA